MSDRLPLISSQNATPREGDISKFPDWRELVVIIMERAWIGGIVAFAVFLFFLVGLARETRYYRSSAMLLVEAQIPRLLNYQDVVAFNSRNLEYFNTIISTLHSQKIMEHALTTSGLATNDAFLPESRGLVAKAAAARRLVQIVPVEKSRLINIMVEYPEPVMASDLANAVAESYIQADLDDRMKASMQAVDWLRERSEEYRQKLEAGLSQLQEYRESTESVSLEEDQNIVIAKLKAINTTLTEAQAERISAETQWQAVDAQLKSGVPMSQIAAQLNDAGVTEALRQLQEQQRLIAELQQRYKPGYPALKQALELETNLQESFNKACDNAVNVLKSRYETLRGRETNLKEALREQEKLAFDLDRKLVRYNDLKRNVEADQEIYQSVIARMKEASISGSLPSEIIRIAEKARPSSRPARPNTLQVLLRGFVFALVLGLGTIFVMYYTDHRFRRNEEIERALGVQVLGTLPMIEGRTVHERGMISQLNQEGEVAESFRTIRAAMSINPRVKDAKVYLITSSQSGEGKSLVAANLGICLAQDGRKTLLIGGDLRRPAMVKIFSAGHEETGLSTYLKGACNWQDALLKQKVPHLDVLPSGKVPSHPSELLGTKRLKDFMAEARGVYDRIIIDAPPILGVSDSLVWLSQADGVLFIVRYGFTHSLGGIHAIKQIRESGTPILGVLMNGVNLKSFANYYYYRRYGGYAYQKYQASSEPPTVS